MLVFAAVFTPQAASTVALIVPEKTRSSAIAFVFLGWSLAVAVGLPIVASVAHHFGWRATFAVLGGFAAAGFVLLAISLPAGLTGAPVSFATWTSVGRNRLILLLLAITVLQTAGPFMIFTYLAPLAKDLAGASPDEIAFLFALGGVTGFVGNLVATRLVVGWGAFRVSFLFQLIMLSGLVAWSLGSGVLAIMAFGIGLWGLGFAALNSMQQARLVGADPKLASASVALNTSSIYVGQAIGSGLGGVLFVHGYHHLMGYAAIVFLSPRSGTIGLTRPRARR